MPALSIGALAKATDVKVTTIRFYEQIGLLPQPLRASNDRRVYDERTLSRLAFIKHARQLGFAVDAIRTLLQLSDNPDQSCEQANILAAEQLAAVDSKIIRLQALRGELQRVVSAACQGRVSDCRVIEVLSDHGHCVADHDGPAALTA
ncbi:MAG: helix-turn-helix domain-containing protein [Pseudomonadota bacterium]|uniref:MerR family transcriptional regulator n=1 Tax=Phenylobacterium sp. TaxID=1871053 RepID=UPI00271F6B7F|nr:helix-turn-helix domain-containing protein [Phenylobacterium sp.]MDO9432367.1 helix-turn-helix domain-containing protein [Phenylobacterium sp.]